MKTAHGAPIGMRLASAMLLLFLVLVYPAQAANECQVYYTYKTNTGSTGSQTLNLDEGDVQSIGTGNVQVIQNKKNYPVQVEITALGPIPNQKKWVTLNNSGDKDPPFSVYPAPVTLYRIECGGSAFGSPADLVNILNNAGATAETIAQALVTSFGQSGSQVAQLLKSAGFDASSIARGLNAAFNTNGQQVAGWLEQANIAAIQTAQALKETFNAGAQQVAGWMEQAGYALNDVALCLRQVFNTSVGVAADILSGLYDTTTETLQAALEAAGYAASQVNAWLASQMSIELVIGGYTGGFSGQPARLPTQAFPLNPGRNEITIRGAALVGTTSIVGLPRGATTTILNRGTGNNGSTAYWTYLHVQIDVPTRTSAGTRGSGTLRLGASNGPRFDWVVEEPRTPPGGGGGRLPPQGGGGTVRPDLSVLNTQNDLYIVGTANTLDANGDFFTALDPFNHSAHCQGIPDGSFNRNNQPTSNTREITVPDVRWGVENTSSVAVTTPFIIELWQGNQRVDSQQVNGLAARSRAEFTFRRPNSLTTVAKVGLGGGCFHAGQAREGWNDNPGFNVRIDTNDDVDESRETNNARNL